MRNLLTTTSQYGDVVTIKILFAKSAKMASEAISKCIIFEKIFFQGEHAPDTSLAAACLLP